MPRLACALAVSFALLQIAAAQEPKPEAFQLGLGLQQRGLHADAARQFAEFLRGAGRHPLAAEASYRRGTCLEETGDHAEAAKSLRQALQLGGREFALAIECRYRLAQALGAAGDHAAAGQEYDRLLADIPADHYLLAAARYGAAECQRERGGDEAALGLFVESAAAATGEAAGFRFPALYQAGFAALRLGRPGIAAEHFGAAAESATEDAGRHECRYLAGDASLRAGDPAAARRWLEQAIADQRGEFADDAALALGFCALAAADQEAALAAFQDLAARHAGSPLLPRAQLEIGRIRYQRGDHAGAEQVLRPLTSGGDAELSRQAGELLSLCAVAGGRGAEAIEPLQQAVAAAPRDSKPRLQFALGEALADAGRWEEALAAYEGAAGEKDAALRGDALYGSCFALHQLGRHDESLARARRLRQELPDHRLAPMAAFAIAENLFAQAHYEEAAKEYEAVPEDSPQAKAAAFKLAWCSYLRGDRQAACTRFLAISRQDGPQREEALSLAALAALEAGEADQALRLSDDYRARYQQGAFLDRTERVAASVLRQRGDLAGAAARLDAAAQNSKDGSGDADRIERAELDFQRGDFQSAGAAFEQLAARDDELGARALEGLAWCAFELGDDDQCAQRLQLALKHPHGASVRPRLLELRAALNHRRKDYRAAIADLETFLREFPAHARAPAIRYALGIAQARGDDQAAARRTLAQLAQHGGYERMDRVHYELAWACRRDGDEAAATAAFTAVLGCSADEELLGEARLHLGMQKLQQQDVDGAAQLLLAVQGSHRPRALYELSFSDLQAAVDRSDAVGKARLQRAEFGLREVVGLPDTELALEATFLLGEICIRKGDPKGAAERLRALLQQAPQHERAQRARLLLAEAAAALGEGDEAVEQSQRFLQGKPTDRAEQARAWLAQGLGRQLRSEHQRAAGAFAKVTELSDGAIAAEAQFRIGDSRKQDGDLAGAVDAYVKLPILYAHAEWVRRGLLQAGLACEQLEQTDKAQKLFAELVQRYPDSTEATAARERLGRRQSQEP